MKTFANEGFSEITEKKSRFLGYARRLENANEAEEWLAGIRKRHPDARHCVCAYITESETGECVRCSDDGEPQGTGGKPLLNVIQRRELCRAGIAVVRYFGGILLGAPGLVRAYGSAAIAAADDAGIVVGTEKLLGKIECGYSEYRRITPLLSARGAVTEKTEYTENVCCVFSADPAAFEAICASVTELTSGTVRVMPYGKKTVYTAL